MHIRQEKESDYSQVFNLIQEAFEQSPKGNHSEQFLVERLRQSTAFIPELSLLAEEGTEIIGHILLSPIKIKNKKEELTILALAPVSVKPAYQRQGVGSRLILEAHKQAKALGYTAIALIGHQNYYSRFGYLKASSYNIQFPFEAPDENCMIFELEKGALEGISGTLEYPEAFFI